MVRIKSLKYKGKIYKDPTEIEDVLKKKSLFWLNKAEIENAIIEIKENKLYWLQGVWYYGTWEYGVWLDGIFKYGTWLGGVWYNGLWMNGTWENGIWMNGTWENGTFNSGEFRNGEKIKGNFNNENENLTNESEKVLKYSNFRFK